MSFRVAVVGLNQCGKFLLGLIDGRSTLPNLRRELKPGSFKKSIHFVQAGVSELCPYSYGKSAIRDPFDPGSLEYDQAGGNSPASARSRCVWRKSRPGKTRVFAFATDAGSSRFWLRPFLPGGRMRRRMSGHPGKSSPKTTVPARRPEGCGT